MVASPPHWQDDGFRCALIHLPSGQAPEGPYWMALLGYFEVAGPDWSAERAVHEHPDR